MSQGTVRLVIDLLFDGDYYREEERARLAKRWIDSGLDDRSDLAGWSYIEESHKAVED